MNIDDLKPFPVSRLGGQVDYQDSTKVINGCALVAQMVRFLPDQVETCFGTVDTMRRPQAYEEVTGINVLDVLGVLNPGELPILFGDQGTLLEESPAGSGALVPVVPPFPLPAGAYMRTTDAENTMTMAFSDGSKGLCPPLRLNGVTKLLAPAQNPIGGLWAKDLIYQVGDLVRSGDARWWRCTQAARTPGSAAGPQWPQFNGYFSGGAFPVPGVWNPATATDVEFSTATTAAILAAGNQNVKVTSILGMVIGHSMIIDVGINQETVVITGINDGGPLAPGVVGTFTKPHALGVAIVSYNGGSAWEEWTPACAQYLPTPDVSNYGVVHNPGGGTIAAGKDVYIKLSYLSGTGVSPRSAALVFVNTGANDAITVGQNGAGGVLAVNGGFGMPRWVAEILLQPALFGAIPMRVAIYVAAVATGAAAPADAAYQSYAPVTAQLPCNTITVTSIPVAGVFAFSAGAPIAYAGPSVPAPFVVETGAGAYIGAFGQRYMIVTRINRNGSLAPVDPNSAISVSLVGQLQLPIVNITRDSSGNVEATVGDVTIGWIIGSVVKVAGCTGDTTFNGDFALDNVQPTLNPQGVLSWDDPLHLSASNDQTGTVTLPAGPPPVAFLPPGGPNDLEDIAAFGVVGGSQAGPFFYVSESTPQTPFSSPILSMEGSLTLRLVISVLQRFAGGMVQCTVPDISGVSVGMTAVIEDQGDASFDGSYTIEGVTPGTGTAGVIQWTQSDIATGGPGGAGSILIVQVGQFGSVQVTVQDASGFSAGDMCLLDTGAIGAGHPATAFDTVAPIASISGNVVTVPLLAAGSPTIYQFAKLKILQNLPTTAPASPQTILSIARDAAGNVQASVGDVGGYAAGQAVDVTLVPTASFNGPFELLGVRINADGVSGTLSWVQPGLGVESDIGHIGMVGATPDILINYQDELLVAEQDNEVTQQLSMSPPPSAADVYFVPSLRKYVYTRGLDSIFIFSETDDAENIDLQNGSLSVDDNSMSLAICVREARTGEIIALKADGGYAVNPSDLPPSEWPCPTRWTDNGPPCAAAVGKGKDFLIFPSFWSQAGCYLYKDGQLDWLTEEFQKVWDRVTPGARNAIWTIVDEQEKEVQIGVPLDGATTPSHIVVGSYIGGWGPQEVLNRYGKLITARSAIRWSIRPRATRAAAVVRRTLATPQASLSIAYPFTSVARVAGVVTATYAAALPPVTAPGGTIHITGVPDGTFNSNAGDFPVVAAGVNTVSWLQNPVGDPQRITSWNWVGAGGTGSAALQIPGQIPLGVFTRLYVRGTNSALDGSSYLITSIVQGVGFYTVNFSFATLVLGAAGIGGICQFIAPAPNAASGAGNSYVALSSPTPTTDTRVQSRQVLIAPSGPDIFESVQIVSADRRTGVRGDATVGGVLTLRFIGPLEGNLGDVIVSGMSDDSFDGEYDEPCTAAWGADGVHSILQFKTSGATGVAYGGQVFSTIECLRVVMQDPTRLDDNGLGLDSVYTPAFAQSPTLAVIRWGAFNIQVGGNGRVLLTPQTEDPTQIFEAEEIDLDPMKATKLQAGLRVPDNEYLTLSVSNGKKPGQGFVLQDLILYGVPIFSGRRV